MGSVKKIATASIKDAIALAVTTYFEQKDAKEKVYTTSDGFLFENAGFAKNHAATLEDKEVVPHTNANSLEVLDDEHVGGGSSDDEDTPPAGPAATQDRK